MIFITANLLCCDFYVKLSKTAQLIKRVELDKQPVCVCEAGYKRQQKPVLRPDSRGSLQTCARLTSLSVSQRRRDGSMKTVVRKDSFKRKHETAICHDDNTLQPATIRIPIPAKILRNVYNIRMFVESIINHLYLLTTLRTKENWGLLSEMKGKGRRENDGVPDGKGRSR